jgi:hypothetical protein
MWVGYGSEPTLGLAPKNAVTMECPRHEAVMAGGASSPAAWRFSSGIGSGGGRTGRE